MCYKFYKNKLLINRLNNNIKLLNMIYFDSYSEKLGIGDWGLGIGDWAQSPIPNPQSPIPSFIIIFIASHKKLL
jgi:hypothetical protein